MKLQGNFRKALVILALGTSVFIGCGTKENGVSVSRLWLYSPTNVYYDVNINDDALSFVEVSSYTYDEEWLLEETKTASITNGEAIFSVTPEGDQFKVLFAGEGGYTAIYHDLEGFEEDADVSNYIETIEIQPDTESTVYVIVDAEDLEDIETLASDTFSYNNYSGIDAGWAITVKFISG